jgi:hypothetical protein
MLDRMRAIYPALSSTLAASWVPLTIGLMVVAVIFGADGRA